MRGFLIHLSLSMIITKLCHSYRKYFAPCSGLVGRFRPAFRIQNLLPFDKLRMVKSCVDKYQPWRMCFISVYFALLVHVQIQLTASSVIIRRCPSPTIIRGRNIDANALNFVDTICNKKKNCKKNNSLRLHCFVDCNPSELITQLLTLLYYVFISLRVYFSSLHAADRLDHDAHKCLI